MTNLVRSVHINRRFARSARLDADLNGTPPLVGYVLQASVEKALTTLAMSQIDAKQGAFTWTGPYGGGKSSAALLMANLVAGAQENRKIARKIAGKNLASLYAKAFPEISGSWKIVAVTGARVQLRHAIADAAALSFKWDAEQRTAAAETDDALIKAISAASVENAGVLLVLDELGKLLEHEASNGGDVHLLQDLAERSSRSEGRLVVIGILHQAFDQYAARATRDSRQEWVKVQGRYQDIPFLAGADETVALLGRAITCDERPPAAATKALDVAKAIGKRRPVDEGDLAKALQETWPLNPVTALLLGPVSRQRFAQNERSVFGFLSSAEPFGFQEYINRGAEAGTYNPDQLWDYLVSNFGMALASGSDGSRFSLAFEAIERVGAKGNELHISLTKSAAIIEFFRNGSGLAVAEDILAAAVPAHTPEEVRAAISDLLDWAVLIRQPRLNGYALFAGSDFDLEDAVNSATAPLTPHQLAGLAQRVGLGYAPAKRHYFRTGALRSFEVNVQMVCVDDSPTTIADRILAAGEPRSSGRLVLLLGDGNLNSGEIEKRARAVAKQLGRHAVVAVGGIGDGFTLRSSAAELFAVEKVFREHPQLEGDRIARREIAARRSAAVDAVHRSLSAALNIARWHLAPNPDSSLREPLAIVASALADEAFARAPILKSELLQRDRLSSNAMAALRELCYAMVRCGDQENLGFAGYPAEMGLYLTVLKPFGIHGEIAPGHFGFQKPAEDGQGQTLREAWAVLDDASDTTVEHVYSVWAKPPFGIKFGVMPAIVLANLISNRDRLAVYLDGVFQTDLDDVFVDRLLQKPSEVRLKRVDRSMRQTALLSDLAKRFELVDGTAALPVAQALFRRYTRLSQYAKRTDTISELSQAQRAVVLKSTDPEALLFDGLPAALGDKLSAATVFECLTEAEASYGQLQETLLTALARALAVDRSFAGLADRAASIRGLTNDLAFEAFAMRAAAFEREKHDIDGLASLLLHKPLHSWSDRDREQALLQLARYGRQFRELEALAVVRDRRSSTEALALVIGVDPKTPPLMRSFVLTETEKQQATALADELLKSLLENEHHGRIRFAALARAVASLAADTDAETLS
ncbi:ATP-binding protein [Sinorhizobium medicae]|uniref:ATP-binding protein n=1 Tax=Sinorhizobium medicae TaxID=110321 RepID=UPI0012973413|nr:ATP-binding protein [Sinorhizobium medicae]MDX0967323.1 ATP-binding protein [Sinorhizobium medicae]MQV46307.1 ATP-binding protein [Sinorhizobium medicae]MQV54038.1 ATP-binding protein [Sinorhizobium medicae]MQV71677.1 ATP-binding protein [Sinorhizobium medicae]